MPYCIDEWKSVRREQATFSIDGVGVEERGVDYSASILEFFLRESYSCLALLYVIVYFRGSWSILSPRG